MKVKMTNAQYARWVKAEMAHEREEEKRLRRLEEGERLEKTLQVDFSDLWQDVAKEDPLRWPLIVRASQVPKGRAFSPVVEWNLAPKGNTWRGNTEIQGSPYTRVESNYTQIFRVPWTEWVSNATLASTRYGMQLSPFFGREKLLVMLDLIETAMRDGQRYSARVRTLPLRMAGSVPSLLGRWPRKDDHVEFKVLRDMTLLRQPELYSGERDARPFRYEYIFEASWMAYPKIT